MTHTSLLVKDGKLEVVEVGDYKDIQKFVDGYFTTAFRLPGYGADYETITAWCDDEFLLKGRPLEVAVDGSIYRGGYAYGGPVLIMGTDERTGETRSLTQTEIEAFSLTAPELIAVQGMMLILPTISYKFPDPTNRPVELFE